MRTSGFLRITRVLVSTIAFFVLGTECSRCAEPEYVAGSTRKVYQLTGDFDQTLRRPTRTLTQTNASVISTDLGSSFEHKGELYFLFGDTTSRAWNNTKDCWAKTSATNPEDVTLEFPAADNVYQPIEISGISQVGMEVPSYGISANGKIYIVHTTDWHGPTGNMERSVLAKSEDDGLTWSYVYDLSAVGASHDMTDTHFINVSMEKVQAEDYPGELPYASGEMILIWGSGAYRKSSVYLACIPSAVLENKGWLMYFAGHLQGGIPQWSSMVADSEPLFVHEQVGEFSVDWIEPVKRWVMLYNASSPRGITMRTAAKPWGPYSDGSVIFDPWSDGGYGRFIHVPLSRHMDAFHDSGRAEVWGGEYGPYLIPRFCTGKEDSCFLYYTMSTWNPYQVVLMRSTIGAPLPPVKEIEIKTLYPGDSEWRKSSSDFFTSLIRWEKSYISTLGTTGASSKGFMWRWLPRDSRNLRIRFSVDGGDAEVLLIEGGGDIPASETDADAVYSKIKNGDYGDVIQCAWGHDSDDISVSVSWSLSPFDSANLKIVIIDKSEDSFGYVNVSEMTLLRDLTDFAPCIWSVR